MTWKVQEPLHVDAGELSGVSPELAFTLGVEWAMARVALVRGRVAWPMLVHAENARRIELLARRHGVMVASQDAEDAPGWSEVRPLGPLTDADCADFGT